MTQLIQVAQRILSMSGAAQQKAVEKMRASGMDAWSFPIPQGVVEPRCAKLTPAQQEMYATQKALPQDPRFHLYGAYRVQEGFDLEALRQALEVLMARHGALRTRFVHQNGELVQEMVSRESVDLGKKIHWHEGPAAIESWIEEGVAEPLPLDQAGLWRVRCRRDEEGVVVLAVFHHLICDAWSMGQLVRELGGLLQGGSPSPTPATHFVDYAAWRELWFGAQDPKADQEYWKRYLGSAQLGWRHEQGESAEARRFGQGRKLSQTWSQRQSDALHEAAKRWETTPFLLLLAGFYQVLDAMDPATPWVVASTVADRPCADVEQSLGYFVKTLLTRSPRGESPEQRLRALQQDWASAQAHDLSLGRVLKTLRDSSSERAKSPAILFVLHNTPKGGGEQQTWKPLSIPGNAGRAFARFAWSIRVDASAGAPVQVSCEYDQGLFAQSDLEVAMEALKSFMDAWLSGDDGICFDASSLENLKRRLASLGEAPLGVPEGPSPSIAPQAHPTPSAIEATLCQIWSQVLGKEQVLSTDNFFALGGDSISSLQVVSRALRQGWWVSAQDLASTANLAELAQRVRKATLAKLAPGTLHWTEEPRLSAAQRWFFALGLNEPEYFNQSYLLVTRKGLDMKTIMSSLSALVQRHEALRMRFVQSPEGQWQARPCPLQSDDMVDFLSARVQHIDQSKKSEREAEEELLEQSHAAMRGHSFDDGGLFQVQYFDRGFRQEGRLLVVLHHLIVDGVSWRLLLSQWDALVAGHSLDDTLASPFALGDDEKTCDQGPQATPLVPDQEVISNKTEQAQGALAQCRRVFDTATMTATTVKERSHALLSAWVQAVAEQQEAGRVVVDLESHGRETPEAALCVGWLTQRHSVVFEKPGDAAHNLARLQDEGPAKTLWHRVQLCFNDHGHARVDLDQVSKPDASDEQSRGLWARPLRLGSEEVAPPRAPEDRRAYPWTLNCYHDDQGLHAHWLYDPRLHAASTIQGILDRVAELLQERSSDASAAASQNQRSPVAMEQDATEMNDILEALNQ